MIKNVGTAEHYRWGQDCDGWRLPQGPDLSVIQERSPVAVWFLVVSAPTTQGDRQKSSSARSRSAWPDTQRDFLAVLIAPPRAAAGPVCG